MAYSRLIFIHGGTHGFHKQTEKNSPNQFEHQQIYSQYSEAKTCLTSITNVTQHFPHGSYGNHALGNLERKNLHRHLVV